MINKIKKFSFFLVATALVILFAMWFVNCSKSENEKPKIVGCNSVEYQGQTYSNIGCEVGIRSFNYSLTQGGKTVSFHIECSKGCIASVEVIDGGNSNTITGPCPCTSSNDLE